MKASTRKTRKRYMNDEDFSELQASLNEAIAYAKGERPISDGSRKLLCTAKTPVKGEHCDIAPPP